MTYLLLFILIIGVLVIFIDVIPQVNTWQSRIKVGRFQNREDWTNKVLVKSKNWLRKIPTVPLTDNKRLIVVDMLQGNYKRSAIQSWQEAALVLGLSAAENKIADRNIQKEIKRFFETRTDSTGAWKEKPPASDHAILAYAILNVDFVDSQQYRSALDETYQMILSLKGKDGTVAYKNHVPQYRFVDTIGFICPFLVSYGVKFNVPEAIDLAINQITQYQKYGMMPGENIPCHTYLVDSKIPVGLFGWGRGLGWFTIGLIDSWAALPEGHSRKKELEEIVIKTARSALKFQHKSGGFNWLLFVKESRLDSSTTATLCWFFSLASQIPEIADGCISAKEAGLKYLQWVTRRNGAVDFSQGDTKGIGVYSQNFDVLPFTQGFVLRTLYFTE